MDVLTIQVASEEELQKVRELVQRVKADQPGHPLE